MKKNDFLKRYCMDIEPPEKKYKLDIIHQMPDGNKIRVQSYIGKDINQLKNDFLIKAQKFTMAKRLDYYVHPLSNPLKDGFKLEYKKGKTKKGYFIGELKEI